MEPSPRLFALRFDIRYAQRCLELEARLYRRIDYASKTCQLLSGTAAFAAIVNGNSGIALGVGLILAATQAVDFVLRPGDRAAEATRAALPYRQLRPLAAEEAVDDVRMRLDEVIAKDDLVLNETVRRQAYNDVAMEMGVDAQHLYVIPRSLIRLLV